MFYNKILGIGSKEWKFYKILVLIAMLQSFRAWFLTFIPSSLCALILLLVTSYFFISKKGYFNNKIKLFNPYWYLLAIIISANVQNFYGIIASIASGIVVLILSRLRFDLQKDLFDTILNMMSIILLISSVGWILYLLGVSLPHTSLTIGHYSFGNCYLFIDNEMYLLNRFSSIFLEPGYLGCLCALFLFLDDYKFTKRNIIFYLSLILTISLAGYLITFIGICLKYLRLNKRSIVVMAIVGSVVYGGLYYANNYNNGNNWLNEGIVSRLLFDNSKGSISGDNRSTETFDFWFWNTFVYSDNLLFGMGERDQDEDVADWKVYVVVYGLVSFLFYIIYLLSPIFKKMVNNRYSMIGLVILNALMFYQTCYGMHWYMYVFTFVLGLGYIHSKQVLCYDAK